VSLNSDLKTLAEELSRVLNEKQGQGLAAPQLGELVRVFVMKYRGKDLVVVNPTLKHKKGAWKVVERCFSIPEKWYEVKRPQSMTLFGTDLDGGGIKIKCDHILSSVVEHEVDHLSGILIDKKGKEVQAEKDKPLAYPKLAYA